MLLCIVTSLTNLVNAMFLCRLGKGRQIKWQATRVFLSSGALTTVQRAACQVGKNRVDARRMESLTILSQEREYL